MRNLLVSKALLHKGTAVPSFSTHRQLKLVDVHFVVIRDPWWNGAGKRNCDLLWSDIQRQCSSPKAIAIEFRVMLCEFGWFHRLTALRMMEEISLISALSSRSSASSKSRSKACIALALVELSGELSHGSSWLGDESRVEAISRGLGNTVVSHQDLNDLFAAETFLE